MEDTQLYQFCVFCKAQYRDCCGNWNDITPRALLKLSAHGMQASCCPGCIKVQIGIIEGRRVSNDNSTKQKKVG